MILLLGTGAAFGLMILLIKKRVPLGICLIAGGITVGLTGFKNPQSWADAAYFALFSRSTLELAAIILLINLIGGAMGTYGILDRINAAMDRVFPDKRYMLAFFPAAIGMLNVTGGAILSAPLVDRTGSSVGLSADQKAATNLLFRHFWFFVYPFYASMVVLQRLSGVDTLAIIKLGIPPALVGFLASWKYCFRGWKQDAGNEKVKPGLKDIYPLVYNLSPILLALVAALVFKISYILALLVGVFWVELINAAPLKAGEARISYLRRRVGRFFRDALAPSVKWQLILIPVGINFFRSTLTSTGAARSLADLLMSFNIPVEVLVFLIPLVISFSTGMHLASVTISVPLFLPLLGEQSLLQPMFLLLMAGTVGYWMSPLHLCLILTQEYMKASYAGTVRIMFRPTLLVTLTGAAVYLLAR